MYLYWCDTSNQQHRYLKYDCTNYAGRRISRHSNPRPSSGIQNNSTTVTGIGISLESWTWLNDLNTYRNKCIQFYYLHTNSLSTILLLNYIRSDNGTCEISDSASVRFTKWMELRNKEVDWSPKSTSPISSSTLTWIYGSFGGEASWI